MVNKLEQLDKENLEIIEYSRRGIDVAKEAMERLKAHILDHPFSDDEEEIYFFKKVKPLFLSKLIYYFKLYHLEIHRPLKVDRINQEKYLKYEIRRVRKHYKRHQGLYAYYKSSATHADRQYFLRQPGYITYDHDTVILVDAAFQTPHDNLFAEFMSNEVYYNYLYTQLQEGSNIGQYSKDTTTPEKNLNWTASKVALIELIYALYSAGALNNGDADVKEIANYFSQMLHIDIGNFYRTFQEIRLRKKSRTAFLQHLIDRIENRMNYWDENPHFNDILTFPSTLYFPIHLENMS